MNPLTLPPGRARRRYMGCDLEKLLKETHDIATWQLMPCNPLLPDTVLLNESPDPAPFPPYLPLLLFDNEDYECRRPEDWLGLGCSEDDSDRRPVPAMALLPLLDADLLSESRGTPDRHVQRGGCHD